MVAELEISASKYLFFLITLSLSAGLVGWHYWDLVGTRKWARKEQNINNHRAFGNVLFGSKALVMSGSHRSRYFRVWKEETGLLARSLLYFIFTLFLLFRASSAVQVGSGYEVWRGLSISIHEKITLTETTCIYLPIIVHFKWPKCPHSFIYLFIFGNFLHSHYKWSTWRLRGQK